MSDYPFKVGDLVQVRSSYTDKITASGVIVCIHPQLGYFEILVNEKVRKVHKNLVVVPKIKGVKITGGLK